MKKTNNVTPEIKTVASRSLDAVIKIGIISVEFKGKNIKLVIDNNDRNANKQHIANIEYILHDHIGMEINEDNIKKLADKLSPIATRLKTLT